MVGEVIQGFASVGAGSYIDIQPAAAIEWVVHNIYHPNNVEVMIVNGGNECAFMEEAGKNFLTNIYLHVTNAQFVRVYNRSGGAIYIAYDGVLTVEP